MKNIEIITREEINQIIEQYKRTFDIVRLVDPDHTAVLHFRMMALFEQRLSRVLRYGINRKDVKTVLAEEPVFKRRE